MLQKFLPLLVIGVWGAIALPLSGQANATIPLTRAEIQELRNLVQLIPRNSPKKRPARKSDAMIPGDGLSTGRKSLADLRFNDGSLARIGEQAVFQFLPKTRNFRLSNGTVLLLIPPGRGQTRIQTPNAAAAIRGSALFVRYDEQTDTTIVGALTNSGIEVSNKASQSQVLEAGQLMVIVKGRFQGLYDFDLRNFYETSDLVRGLDLTRQNLAPTPDPAIASVQAETAAAVATQTPLKGEGVVENPSFLQLTASSSNSATQDAASEDSKSETSSATNSETKKEGSSLNGSQESLPVESIVDTGQAQSDEQVRNNTDTNQKPPTPDGGGKPPVIDDGGEKPPTPDDAGKPPVIDDGGEKPPTPDDGGKPPVIDDGGEKPPTPDDGGKPPVIDDGGEKPPKPDDGG
ncbi:FecR domain-containing protein, partial [Tolypothrix tenuis]|uniref:FecR domain-containing protein n=1 Tax=Tolypothrix tenuis TaxID=457083 RepID=UPI0030D86DC9